MVRTRSGSKGGNDVKEEEEERKKWEVILKGLKQIVLRKSREIDYVGEERDILRHSLQNALLSSHSDALLFRNHISQLKRELELSRLSNATHVAHSHFIAASSNKDALLLRSRLEDTRLELDDFRSRFHILSQTPIPAPAPSPTANANVQLASLEAQLKFAWAQFNEKELFFTNQLHSKNHLLNTANDKIVTLLHTLDQLQSSISDKDHLLSTLTATINTLETQSRLKDQIIADSSKELELLKSNSLIGISTFNRCSAGPPSTSKLTRSSRDRVQQQGKPSSYAQLDAANASLRSQLHTLQIQANLKNEQIAALSKELNSLNSKTIGSTGSVAPTPKEEASDKGGKRSKRKRADVISIEDTPRLFTSEFRVPKLRSQSPDRR